MTWRVRLGAVAEQDLRDIFVWTHDRFGIEQARRYRGLIVAAVAKLAAGPDAIASRPMPEVCDGARILPIGPRRRHFLLYRIDGANHIVIARILHAVMNFERQVAEDDRD